MASNHHRTARVTSISLERLDERDIIGVVKNGIGKCEDEVMFKE